MLRRIHAQTAQAELGNDWMETLAACRIPPNILGNRSLAFRNAVKKAVLKGTDCKYSGLTRIKANTTVLDQLHTCLNKVNDGHIERMEKAI